MERIGIGIVGAGFIANLHAQTYQDLRGLGAEVVGITSRTASKATAIAAEHGIARVLPDYQRLLAVDTLDVVDLCVPNQYHRELALLAAQAGKHVICEKPLTGYFGQGEQAVGATSRAQMLQVALRDADAMLAAAEEHGVKLMYAENWLYTPTIHKAKRLLKASGGTIFDLRGEESHHGSHAAYAKRWRESGGGALLRLGAHPVGAVLHLKACEGIWRNGRPIRPATVVAQVANLTSIDSYKQHTNEWIVNDWDDVENWATVILTFTDGAKAVISASDNCLGGMKDTLDIFASNARIHCNFSRNTLLEAYAPDPSIFADEYLSEKLETKAGWSFPSVGEEWLLGYHAELQDFVEAVKFDRAPVSDGQLGRDVVQVIYSAYLSAEEGRVVQLDDPA